MVTAANASALVNPVIEENITVISQHMARGGAVTIPGVSCGPVCSDLWLEEHRPIPSQPSSAAMWEDFHQAQRQARGNYLRVIPPLRTLGTIDLAVQSFGLGWVIGSGINAKWLHIGVPEEITDQATARWDYMRYHNAGAKSFFGATWPSVDGWVAYFRYNGSEYNRWFAPPCTFSGFTPPGAFSVLSEAASGQCLYGPNQYAGIVVQWGEIAENELGAPAPIEDYSGQPYIRSTPSWAGAPTTQAELDNRVRQAFEGGQLTLPQRWYLHFFQPERYPDPFVTATKEDHRCDRAPGPTYKNPDGNVTPDPFAAFIPTEFTLTHRPPGTEGVPVFLRYGTTHWIPGKHPETEPQYLDDWGGWGLRHIEAKHGWGDDDLAETQAALLGAVPYVDPDGTGKWRYDFPVGSGQGGVGCLRRVVVDFGTGPGDPASRGIVSSFNVVQP